MDDRIEDWLQNEGIDTSKRGWMADMTKEQGRLFKEKVNEVKALVAEEAKTRKSTKRRESDSRTSVESPKRQTRTSGLSMKSTGGEFSYHM
jgi:hypothetical protein